MKLSKCLLHKSGPSYLSILICRWWQHIKYYNFDLCDDGYISSIKAIFSFWNLVHMKRLDMFSFLNTIKSTPYKFWPSPNVAIKLYRIAWTRKNILVSKITTTLRPHLIPLANWVDLLFKELTLMCVKIMRLYIF